MSTTLRETDFIRQYDRSIVDGYLRILRQSVASKLAYYNPAAIVEYWCVLYFAQREYFKCNDDESLECNASGKVITKITSYRCSRVTGNVMIDGSKPLRYIWEIKVIDCHNKLGGYWMKIGLHNLIFTPNDYSSEYHDDFRTKGNKALAYSYRHNGAKQLKNLFAYGMGYEDGDIIKMELNVKSKTLEFYNNGKPQGIAFQDIKFGDKYLYCLGIIMTSTGNAVELLDFYTQKIR